MLSKGKGPADNR